MYCCLGLDCDSSTGKLSARWSHCRLRSSFHWRYIRKIAGEQPAQEEYYRHVNDQLQHSVADDVSGFQFQNAEQRQHPKRINEIGERLGRVVDLYDPSKVNLV